MRNAFFVSLAVFSTGLAWTAAGCGEDSTSAPPDSGAAFDAPTSDSTPGPGIDSGRTDDAGTDADAGGSLVGSDATDPGLSCLDVQAKGGARGDGVYWLKPTGGSTAFQARCDMTKDTGGWTLVANYPLGTQTTPPNWSTVNAEGTAFSDVATVFKLTDAMINTLKTTGYRVHAKASSCLTVGACAIDNTLYFKPACTFSSIATSADCSTAYTDSAFTTLTSSGAAPDPCTQHRGLVDYTCGVKGGVVTNHDPAFGDAGIFLCVGELTTDKRACVARAGEVAGVQIWVR